LRALDDLARAGSGAGLALAGGRQPGGGLALTALHRDRALGLAPARLVEPGDQLADAGGVGGAVGLGALDQRRSEPQAHRGGERASASASSSRICFTNAENVERFSATDCSSPMIA